ncbi:hypothetical protein GGX14DRAFT_585151 [Mycena pura]|uniref:Ubiquitinyl hydrolase 1 n=1 Tax=Mycena pura TaxID=153505 RepID=A0AAD6YIM5_9AGAR|nr:hypothetical protein GGX14DRAFT_585151 [Mycena pura]
MRDIGFLKVADLRIFTWRVRNRNELYSQKRSPEFECGGQRWYALNPTVSAKSPRLIAIDPHISSGQWHSNAQFSLGMSNIYDPTVFTVQHAHHRFTKQASDYEFQRFIAPGKLFTIREGQTRPIIEDGSVDVSAVIRVVEDSKGVVWSRLVTYDSKKETGYVGLINQGATGYMNCVLQSIFFIRSLRRAIYQIPTEGAVPTDSIALALQRLLYNLQTSNGPVATTELTASLGWKTRDVYMQGDAHAFNRLLQDNLESFMKGTSVDGTIEKIYVGRAKSRIKCTDVDYESVMVEGFDDIELNVGGMKNLRDSFKDYVAVEILDGYSTPQFGLQEAKSGLIFESFPPVLRIRLKRFAFQRGADGFELVPTTGRYEYPTEIDLSEFLDEAADRSTPWLYKLHGVTVHSGDLKGGYYFTYIKPDRKEGWFKFYNDNVTRVTEEEVLGNCGGESIGTPSGSTDHSITPGLVKTSTKALLLAYIRDSAIDEVLAPLRDEHIPRHLRMHTDDETTESTPDEKKNLVEEQSYLDVKVVTDSEFSRHGRFDLATIDDKNYPPSDLPTFRVLKTERYAAFKKRVAERLRHSETKFRLWVMVIRQNKTLRPDLCISENEWSIFVVNRPNLDLTSDKQPELCLYLDLISDDPTEQDLARESRLLLLKFFDPASQTLNGVGKVYVLQSDKVSALVSAINKKMGWRAGSPLLLYEEIKPGMVEPIKQDRTITQCELHDGDIICYQPADFEQEMWRHGRYSSAIQYYDFLYRQVIVTFRPKDNAGTTAEFKLALIKDETYDEMAAKVGERLEADPSKLRFWTTYAGDGALKSVVRKELNESVDELIGSGPSSFLILYQRLETSAS